MESGRITLSVRGNYEQMLLRRIELAETNPGEHTWMMHPWFTHDVERADWGKWKAIIKSIPVAATVDTAPGPVGLVHASPTARHWDTMLTKCATNAAGTRPSPSTR